MNEKTHRGNSLLRGLGVQQEWTAEQIEEWIKCKDDPIYFIESYMKIINIDDGLVPFKLRDYQKEMVSTIHGNRFTLIGTARQAGKSTTTTGVLLHYMIFNSDKTIAILANKGQTAMEILSKVQLAYQHLPRWLQHGVRVWNKGSFELENGSRILAAATSSDSIRGYAVNCLFIDEAAHIENWNEFFTSTFPVISSGRESKVILVSTPKGLNHFYKLWDESVQGKNEYKRVEVTWHKIPGRDEKWRQMTLASMGNNLDQFAQEYEMQFLGSSGTLIAGWKLKELVHKTPIKDDYAGFKTYVDPVKGHKYAICADVSEGKGMDYSAFSVIDVTQMPYDQVATFRSNTITAPDFAHVIHNVAMRYGMASVLIEVNIAMGPEVASILHYDLEYENVLFTAAAGTHGRKVSSGFGKNVDKGLRTTQKTKATGCSMLKLLIESNQLIINDFETKMELSTFSRDTKKSFSAEEGCHDDAVMSLVLFAWLSGQGYFTDITGLNTLGHLRERSDEDDMAMQLPPMIVDDHNQAGSIDLELAPGEEIVSETEYSRLRW